MGKISLIVGTDRGVGKTFVTSMIVRRMLSEGSDVCAIKPLETGCEMTENGLYPPDATRLFEEQKGVIPLDVINPFRFENQLAPWMAHSPHSFLSSEETLPEGPDVSQLIGHIKTVADRFECVLVEGAGGLLAPIAKQFNFADLAEELEADVLVVVGSRLGCLNHALLTFEALRARHISVVGYILNEYSSRTDWSTKTNRTSLIALAEPYDIRELDHITHGGELSWEPFKAEANFCDG